MNSNPVADMLTRIRNAQSSAKTEVLVQNSKFCLAIVNILIEEGYVDSVSTDSSNNLILKLKYFNSAPVIQTIQQESKPSCRLYVKKDKIPKFFGGLGIAVLSTSSGLMTDRKARQVGLGGELICSVF